MASRLLSPPSHPEMMGRIGRYDVERMIGSGGMGLVFKAHDTELNRPVAVKLLAPYLAENGSARKRFAREARAAAAVVDEHVVAIHNVESGEDPEKPPFLVMKYIAGGSLQQRLDHDGPLNVCEILRIGMQIAKGLSAAHAQGLIHRDVKPSNILLDEGVERALLTDFGLARAENDACLTRSGFHAGTPHYMSPEQIRGEAIDGRSDQFGLGCVLYAMCTGHPPFRADSSYAVLRRITDDNPRPVREINPDLPVWLDQIVTKLLSKSPDDRFESVEEVAELLARCLAHVQHPTTTSLPDSLSTLSPGRIDGTPRWLKYLSGAAFVLALIFLGVLIVLELNKGTLRIESAADDIPLRIMQGDDVVETLTVTRAGASVRVAAGQYIVIIDGEIDGLHVNHGTVSLTRGGIGVVQIVRTPELSLGAATEEVTVDAENAYDSTAIHQIFATVDGEVSEVAVEYMDVVAKGDALIRLRSHELELQRVEIVSQNQALRAADELVRAQFEKDRDRESLIRKQAEIALKKKKLDAKMALHEQRAQDLVTKSPIAGVVVSRDVGKNLRGRPIEAGQMLLQIKASESVSENEDSAAHPVPESSAPGSLRGARFVDPDSEPRFPLLADDGDFRRQIRPPGQGSHVEESAIGRDFPAKSDGQLQAYAVGSHLTDSLFRIQATITDEPASSTRLAGDVETAAQELITTLKETCGEPASIRFVSSKMKLLVRHDPKGHERIDELFRTLGINGCERIGVDVLEVSDEWVHEEHEDEMRELIGAAILTPEMVKRAKDMCLSEPTRTVQTIALTPGRPGSLISFQVPLTLTARVSSESGQIEVRVDQPAIEGTYTDPAIHEKYDSKFYTVIRRVVGDGSAIVVSPPGSDNFAWLLIPRVENSEPAEIE